MQKVLQSSFPDISGCNVFERRGVIERLEARSEVQLNSERIAVEAGPEADLGFNTRAAWTRWRGVEAWDSSQTSSCRSASTFSTASSAKPLNHTVECFTDRRREGVANPSTFGRHQRAGSRREGQRARVHSTPNTLRCPRGGN